jgi:hypothetical protein
MYKWARLAVLSLCVRARTCNKPFFMVSSHKWSIFLADITRYYIGGPCLSAILFYTILRIIEKCIILYIFSCSSCHWFLAIICFPGLNGSVRFSDNTPIVIPPVTKTKKVVSRKDACKYHEKYKCLHAVACQVSCTVFLPKSSHKYVARTDAFTSQIWWNMMKQFLFECFVFALLDVKKGVFNAHTILAGSTRSRIFLWQICERGGNWK